MTIPAAPPPTQSPPARNGFGTTGFVLGLLSVLFAWIPIIGLIAWPLAILGLIFGILGIRRASHGVATNRGLSIAGAVLAAIGLVICIAWIGFTGNALEDAQAAAPAPIPLPPAAVAPVAPVPVPSVPSVPSEPSTVAAIPEVEQGPVTHKVTYKVSGSGGAATSVTYSTEGFGQEQANGASLPWSKTVEFPDSAFSVKTLVAQSGSGSSSNKITCEILEDGKRLTVSSSSGPYAVVTCSDS